ncbi:MAG: multifunctional CCA tRNA nucleotidyl transferase/2'3'-cyclic phosphodiesterase/2'nucleotidase/phosphatase [Pseudomonadales bacterium]|nr:multifunctional CCA tRNA nucleotidyl transferase/2'3'-cyclic phosphodiesterase/2'nucleotidase/phosphatase [Pseudomonadales bacterium]
METYLVGGAVRNRLLGLPVFERDYVVVGSSSDEMKRLGFRSVGKDFPVFLHPRTGDEYALARTERKTGRGHTDFECETDAVTLEQDLLRRDLTINAIAQDESGNLIDPWGGIADLDAGILRHVSAAFSEDPLRVLRVARFAALLSHLGFRVAPETLALMREISTPDELGTLSTERVWAEIDKALATDEPATFFDVLDGVGAGQVLWPEITRSGIAVLAALQGKVPEAVQRFALVLHGLGAAQAETICARLRSPRKTRDFTRLSGELYDDWRREPELTADEIVDLLRRADAFRQPERFVALSTLFDRLAIHHGHHSHHAVWLRHLDTARSITARDVAPGLEGPQVGVAIRQRQVEAIDGTR